MSVLQEAITYFKYLKLLKRKKFKFSKAVYSLNVINSSARRASSLIFLRQPAEASCSSLSSDPTVSSKNGTTPLYTQKNKIC